MFSEVSDLESSECASSIRKKRFNSRLPQLGLLTLLVWGSVVFLKTLNSTIHGEPGFRRLPTDCPQVTEDGLLKVSFENVRNFTFNPTLQTVQWIGGLNSPSEDMGLFLSVENGSYVIKSVYDQEYSRLLLKGKEFSYKNQNFTVDHLQASPNLNQMLIRSNTVKHWRHSTFGSYFLFDTETSSFNFIGDNIAKAEWSPNSVDIAYVKENDLYVYSSKKHATVSRVTDDGSAQVFNGKPDWVYEEEVLEGDSAMWWSPEGEYLAFFRINETEVQEFPIPYFSQHEDDLYPEVRLIKYPKSGSPNPSVKLMIYSLENDKTTAVAAGNESSLITEVLWVGSSKILCKATDRCSDILSVVLADARVEGKHEVSRIESSEDSWWEITHDTMHIPKDESRGREQDGYIDLVPHDGYNHLAYFSPTNRSKPSFLTRGSWEVVDGPAGFDQDTNDVYFVATKKSSTERHLYRVNLHKPYELTEITDTSKEGLFSVSFSSGMRFALLSYLGPDIPYQKILDLKSTSSDTHARGNVVGKTLYYLEENEVLRNRLHQYAVPEKTFRELNLGEDENGQDILVNSYEILPNDFDPTLRNHYPVFFYAYGGPNSQQVIKAFSVGFNQVVASQLDAIVVVVDGRGTGFKGKQFRSLVRDNLGDFEARDQIAAAKLYSEKSFVDSEKISLFGWSYGGYLTLKTLEKDAGQTFKYGMSVAPVTDWRLYDSVYTERYMHTPQDNMSGYNRSKVHNATALGRSRRFLLMHGSGDDNVHFQNSLRFLDLLDLANVENYDMHVFPDSDHSIRYHNANTIVYDKLLSWARQAFNGDFVTGFY